MIQERGWSCPLQPDAFFIRCPGKPLVTTPVDHRMVPVMNKQDLIQRILDTLQHELRVLEEAARMANEEAIPESDIAESQREPRAVEASYLVDGQSRLALETKEAIRAFERLPLKDFAAGEPVALSAVVEVESGPERTTYFLGPKAGGLEVPVNGGAVYVLTPQSPLARRLLGRNLGETVQVDDGGRTRALRITAVR